MTVSQSISQRVNNLESHVLYNGKVRLDFDPVKHRYKINGKVANGVTTALGVIAKPHLIYWAANKAADYVKENLTPGQALDEIQIQSLIDGARYAHRQHKAGASDMGTYVHNWIEAFVNGENPEMPVSEVLQRPIKEFIKFWERKKPEVVACERMLCSPKHNLAGTADLICRVDGKLTVMDWKTGSGIYPEMFLQMAAYAIMLEEEYPDQKVEQLYVVNPSIVNIFDESVRTEVDEFKKAYLNALELYKSQKLIEDMFKERS